MKIIFANLRCIKLDTTVYLVKMYRLKSSMLGYLIILFISHYRITYYILGKK